MTCRTEGAKVAEKSEECIPQTNGCRKCECNLKLESTQGKAGCRETCAMMEHVGCHCSEASTLVTQNVPSPSTGDCADVKMEACNQLVACVATKGTVNILSCATGKLHGCTTLPGDVFSSPVVVGDYFVVGCRDDSVYCYKLSTVSD